VKPLQGRRVVVTRAPEQAGRLVERLRAAGAEVIEMPTVAAEPLEDRAALDGVLDALGEYDWLVLTSANGAAALGQAPPLPVEEGGSGGGGLEPAALPGRSLARAGHISGLDGRLMPAPSLRAVLPEMPGSGQGADPRIRHRPRLAAVGPATAEALRRLGWPTPWTPSRPNGRALGEELPVQAGERVLLLRSDRADPALADALAGRGARVYDVVAYRTVARQGRVGEPPEADAYVVMSPSAVDGLVDALGGAARLAGKTIVAAGPTTAAHLARLGLPAVQAGAPTPEGIVDALAGVPA
jgi:uroporphyrinogen-III synthase